MSAKHTPGPWIVSPTVEGMFGIFADVTHRQDGYLDACVCAVSAIMDKTEIDEANAHLIAAAPDLLEALDKVWPFLQEDDGHGANAPAYQAAINAARAALTKAKGGNQ